MGWNEAGKGQWVVGQGAGGQWQDSREIGSKWQGRRPKRRVQGAGRRAQGAGRRGHEGRAHVWIKTNCL